LIDNDEFITGKRREAIYGGVNAIVTKPGVSIANWLFLLCIKGFGWVKPIVGEDGISVKQPQTPLAITGILFAYCIPLVVGILLCLISIQWYPLDGPAWRKKKKGIYELHLQKEKEYLQTLHKTQQK
jgi:GPH family glycoside/pentoside/hexuronide:cation symporter